jgi:hypothetical protein
VDSKGTEIWNIIVREIRQIQHNGEASGVTGITGSKKGKQRNAMSPQKVALALVKVFAAFLIDAAYATRLYDEEESESRGGIGASSSSGARSRVVKVFLGAARTCLWAEELGWGTKILERTSSYLEDLRESQAGALGQKLMAEFLILRVVLVSICKFAGVH